METMLTYNTNSKTGPVCGGRAVESIIPPNPVAISRIVQEDNRNNIGNSNFFILVLD